jgi:hypothetical protein
MYYTVHTVRVNSIDDDSDLLIADPLYKWETSDAGQWIMQNALETPQWVKTTDHRTIQYTYLVRAKLTPEQYTYWKLKYE